MAMPSGTVRWLKALKRWRLCIIHENGDHICIVQGVLEVHPGRRREGQGHDKDWTKENTREINWPKLKIFLRRHAKRLNGYIQETFWLYILWASSSHSFSSLVPASRASFWERSSASSRSNSTPNSSCRVWKARSWVLPANFQLLWCHC